MEIKTEKLKIKKDEGAARVLRKWAEALVFATQHSDAAKAEVLYGLPGVFSMSLQAGGKSLRLIKEGDSFRILKSSEISDVLLSIRLEDRGAEEDIIEGRASLAKLFSEGRVTYRGSGKSFNCVMRIDCVSDKLRLSERKRKDLYGS
ncbi:MAG: hypothetical protein J6Y74_05340 [Clostridia bacterium]|nr:hypothetical protein [Clostridia bacterium]